MSLGSPPQRLYRVERRIHPPVIYDLDERAKLGRPDQARCIPDKFRVGQPVTVTLPDRAVMIDQVENPGHSREPVRIEWFRYGFLYVTLRQALEST